MTRIMIIENEIIIGRFIERQLQTNFVCETRIAVSAAEVRTAMPEMLPHLLLCDIHLEEELTGIHLVNELRPRYAFEVIFISSYQIRNIIEQAAAAHPASYLIKPIDEMQLFASVQLVISRLSVTHPTGKAFLPSNTHLSETELRILQLIREKKSTLEIAESLHLSRFTVKNHRHSICRKLDLREENNALLKWMAENGTFLK